MKKIQIILVIFLCFIFLLAGCNLMSDNQGVIIYYPCKTCQMPYSINCKILQGNREIIGQIKRINQTEEGFFFEMLIDGNISISKKSRVYISNGIFENTLSITIIDFLKSKKGTLSDTLKAIKVKDIPMKELSKIQKDSALKNLQNDRLMMLIDSVFLKNSIKNSKVPY